MRRSINSSLLVLVLNLICLLSGAASLYAVDPGVAGRAIISKWQSAVVSVRLISKQSIGFGGREMGKRDTTTEVTGTVIDPSGLTVLSLFATDPSDLLTQMRIGGEDGSKMKWGVEIMDIKIIPADGQEISAKIILRDKDLDLAFIRPSEKLSKPMPALDFSKPAHAQILDEIIILNRLGKVGGRVPHVSLSRVEAIVEKPRTFYVPGSNSVEAGLGAPAFALDGKLIGLLVFRTLSAGIEDIGMSGMLGGMSRMGMLSVILPVADILEVAKQVPQEEAAKKKAVSGSLRSN